MNDICKCYSFYFRARKLHTHQPCGAIEDTSPAGKGLTRKGLDRWQQLEVAATREGALRVRAYTVEGLHVGPRDIGEGDERLTFPAKLLVRDALGMGDWVRFASEEEQNLCGEWWASAGFRPVAIVWPDGNIADMWAPIGLCGNRVTVLAKRPQPVYEEVGCDDVGEAGHRQIGEGGLGKIAF